MLRVCTANGVAYDDIDCRTFEQICAKGACRCPAPAATAPARPARTCRAAPGIAAKCVAIARCGVGEDFGNCSVDCPPLCGDGSCNGGDERPTSCALDCVTTCGNGACDGVEDRDNCPGDCGFCGNGVCEDGAESPSYAARQPRVMPRRLRRVRVPGQQRLRRRAGLPCTSNACVSGTCVYQPSDAACPANSKCIKFNGCCADKDRDGYADEACGGSDCDDDDADAHPGAIEPCGGGDRNCNGVHKPTLKPAKKVTDTFSLKSDLSVAQGSSGFVATWTATPEQTTTIEYARGDGRRCAQRWRADRSQPGGDGPADRLQRQLQPLRLALSSDHGMGSAS